jgi:hypothetical protein
MGSYVAFLMLGLYPLPGTRQFLITTPYFPTYRIHNPVYNKTATFIANGFVGNPRTSLVNGTKVTKGEYRYIKVREHACRWSSAYVYLDRASRSME